MKKECYPTWAEDCIGACRHFGVDPDGDYCGHPESLKLTCFGKSTHAMHELGLCTHGENGKYQLWEGRE